MTRQTDYLSTEKLKQREKNDQGQFTYHCELDGGGIKRPRLMAAW